MSRYASIRKNLLQRLTLLVLFTSGAILVATVLGAFQASDDVAREVIEKAGGAVSNEVDRYFEDVERSLRVVARWGQAADLGPTDTDAWGALYQPLIDENPSVSSAMVANTDGVELLVLQDAIDQTRWTTRLVDPGRWDGQAYVRAWDEEAGVLSEGVVPLEYDTVNRLYFRTGLEAADSQAVAWTPPAVFFITKDPGMTAAARWTDTAGRTTVVALDVLLLDVSRMTASTSFSERGLTFVLSDTDPPRVIGLPRDGAATDDEAIRARLLTDAARTSEADAQPELPTAGQSGNGVLDAAVHAWSDRGRPDGSIDFEHEGETWWVNFARTEVGDNAFVVGAAAPQSDFLAGVGDDARRIALVALIAVVLATLLATRLAQGYARPLEALAEASRRIRTLDLSPPEGVETKVAEIRDLVSEQERTRAAIDSFARYIPVEIVRDLVARGVAAEIGGERRVITILFTDIQGFTTIAEGRTAEHVTALLTDYFETLLETIRAHGGEVNQLLGDGVVAYWGAPVPHEDHAARAVDAILACHDRIEALGDRYEREGKPRLPTRFGVSSGEVMVGNVGSQSRLAYAAVGDTANLASRIEGLNRYYGTMLLVSHKTRALAGDAFEWREVDAVRVKGRENTTVLFEPLGRTGEVPPERLAFRDRYENALRSFRSADFEAAIRELESMSSEGPEDISVGRLLQLAREQRRAGAPPDGWDGVTVFHIK